MSSQLTIAPCWYAVLAALFTAYQAYRGYVLQQKLGPAQSAITSAPQRIVVLCVADAILYLLCSAAGFAALWVAYALTLAAPKLNEITAGGAALLIFLWLFGLLGVTGQLPHLIQQGKILPRAG